METLNVRVLYLPVARVASLAMSIAAGHRDWDVSGVSHPELEAGYRCSREDKAPPSEKSKGQEGKGYCAGGCIVGHGLPTSARFLYQWPRAAQRGTVAHHFDERGGRVDLRGER